MAAMRLRFGCDARRESVSAVIGAEVILWKMQFLGICLAVEPEAAKTNIFQSGWFKVRVAVITDQVGC